MTIGYCASEIWSEKKEVPQSKIILLEVFTSHASRLKSIPFTV